MLIEVGAAGSGFDCYFLPLALAWDERGAADPPRRLLPWTLAKVRQRAHMGLLFDAFRDDAFCQAIVAAMGENLREPCGSGQLRFTSTRAFPRLAEGDLSAVVHVESEQSNSLVILGNKLLIKGYRQPRSGIEPEIEFGRFLTEVSPFRHSAPLAGWFEWERGEANSIILGLVQAYVPNEGDGWSYTLAYLERFLAQTSGEPPATEPITAEGLQSAYIALIRTLGRRTGELHQALGKFTGNPAFDPEAVLPEELEAWLDQVRQDSLRTLEQLERQRSSLGLETRANAERLLGLRDPLVDRICGFDCVAFKASKTRYHGDLHLGQALLTGNDFIIVAFKGEPARALAQCRPKHSPLRDVAGMLRSFDYVAAVALKQYRGDAPHAVIESQAWNWQRDAATAFLGGYRAAVDGCPGYPTEPMHARRLIELFVIEKALHELRYELDHRPDWVQIPLRGLLALIEGPPKWVLP